MKNQTILQRITFNGETFTNDELIKEIERITVGKIFDSKKKAVLFSNGKVCRCPVTVRGILYSSWFEHRIIDETQPGLGDDLRFITKCYGKALSQNQVKGDARTNLMDGVSVCALEDQDRNVVSRGYAFLAGGDRFTNKQARNKSRGKAVQYLTWQLYPKPKKND